MTGSSEARAKAAVLDEEATRARAQGLLGETLVEWARLPGGSSGLTYLAVTDRRRAVVKIATPGLAPVRNRDVLRQARLLDRIGGVGTVAVPSVIGTDAGDPPSVPPMFAMTFADGDSYEPLLASAAALSQHTVDQRSDAASRMLAELHRLPTDGLLDAEAPVLRNEVTRWIQAFESADDDLQANSGPVGRSLLEGEPPSLTPAILHGDWRLGNMLCVDTEIRAVIDWEIWSVGDPRLDLAWFELFSDPAHPLRARGHGELARPKSLRSSYVQARGEDLPEMRWFEAQARFKQAAAAALLVKNSRRRPRPGFDPGPPQQSIPVLLDAAARALD